MQTYKERILENIRRRQVSSVPELSGILGISKPAVQYHIQNLIFEGEIESFQQINLSTSRGRPVNFYRIVGSHQPDNLAFLTNTLLSQFVISTTQPSLTADKLKSLAKAMAGTETKPQPFLKRIGYCIERLNQMNYQPHWEVTHSGSRVYFRNCPYKKILSAHPELCRMDQIILECLLELPVEIIQLSKDHPETITSCEFFFSC